VRSGRLAAAGVARRGTPPMPLVDVLLATAEMTPLQPGPLPAALAEETEVILRWLEAPGTRLVTASEPWSLPARGAGRFSGLIVTDRGRDPFADRRHLPMQARPAR
jgi:DNA polymerase-3 subunit epsilon